MSGARSTCQVAVVGGGLVGAAAAAALLRAGLSVRLIERQPARAPDDAWDTRIYAISPASEALLREIGAWQRVDARRLAAIERMDVAGDAGGRLRLDAYEAGVARLATIVESGRLQYALWQSIAEYDPAAIVCPGTVAAIDWGTPSSTLHLDDGTTLAAELVIGADGARSAVRALAGIGQRVEPYGQAGVVANFACERPHRGTAFQWFRQGDVIAYLPLPGNQMSLVWSTHDADALLALDVRAFADAVAAAGEGRLGRLECVTAPAAFPLNLVRVEAMVAPGLALVGDAAHGIHPLAGQGVNLGFADVAALVAILGERGLGRCGDPVLLARYARRRALPVTETQFAMHGLFHLFGGPLARFANLGMRAVDRLGFLKSALVREATRFPQ
jgi:2-octaprenyl-6-methoxyphenol hydroxylase